MEFPHEFRGQNGNGGSSETVRSILSKTSENMKRLVEERNAVLYEYTRVMSERDAVHREINQLQEDLTDANNRYKNLKTDYDQLGETKKTLEHQVEALKIEIASALHDRDVALKELHDKCFPERHWDSNPNASWSKCSESFKDNSDKHLRQEIDELKRHLQKAHDDLEEARQETRLSEKRNDWALDERDQAIRGRDSIRVLCDEMRKEKDRALSEMARAVRHSNDIQRQLQQTFMELKDLKRQLEIRTGQEYRCIDRSDDSAVGSAELTINETETVKVELDHPKGRDPASFGFAVAGGTDPGLYVVSVTNGGSAEGKLKINDRIIKVGNVSCTSSNSETVWNVLKTAEKPVVLTLRRKKRSLAQGLHSVKIEPDQGTGHGLTLENGLYIQSVSPGSAAAKSHLRSGDRVYSINGRVVDSIGARTACQLLDEAFKFSGGFVMTVFRGFPFPSTLPMLPSSPASPAVQSQDQCNASSAKIDRRASISPSQTDADGEADAIAALEDVIDSYNPPQSNSSCDPNNSTASRQWERRGLFRKSEAFADMSQTGSHKHSGPRSWPRRRNSDLSQLFSSCNHPRTRWPMSVFIDAFKTSTTTDVKESDPYSPGGSEMSNDLLKTEENITRTATPSEREDMRMPTSSLTGRADVSWTMASTTLAGDWTSRSESFSGRSRIRLPPNSSLTSAGKYMGRISAGGGAAFSEHDNSNPNFRVEVISPKRSDDSQNQHEPSADGAPETADRSATEELRRIWIEKCSEPLGIQIFGGNSGGGVFVSSVHRSSLAARVGLRVGDQMLEVWGINIRTATYEQAAQLLRHCGGNSLTLLVQYNPDKYYQEVQGLGDYQNQGLRIGSPPLALEGDSFLPHKSSSVDRLTDEESRASSKDTASVVERQMAPLSSLNGNREPRSIYVSTKNSYGLNGISLVGGNRVGIYIHSVEPDSVAFEAGLRVGDRILEFNGVDLREATAEKAAYELGKSAENVKMVVLSDPDRHLEIANQSGDGFYVRAQFDRQLAKESSDQQVNLLSFQRQDILYVDNTMFNGVPGQWWAWLIDEQGRRTEGGLIPSKYKADEEVVHRFRPAPQENESRRSLSRRSFLRWKLRFSRTSWRDSKDISNYSDANLHVLGTSSETLNPPTENTPSIRQSYIRVDRLNRRQVKRPVLIAGPLSDWVVEQVVHEFPDKFIHGALDMLRTASPSAASNPMKLHPTWAMGPSSSESMGFLFHQNIHPIVLFIKFKSAKQVCRLADSRPTRARPVTGKAAKEMFQWSLQMETQRKHLITVVIHVSDGLTDIGTRVKAAVKQEQKRIMWITRDSVS